MNWRERLAETKPFPDLIDFRFIEGVMRFSRDTPEYKLLDQLDEDTWVEYLDWLARYGTGVEYDSVDDQYVVTNMTGL